jgi:hypothetical protein
MPSLMRTVCFTHELLVTDSVAAKVPVEVWTEIGELITSPADLVTRASISPQAMTAAANFVRHPWVKEFRLVDVISSGTVLPIPATENLKPSQIWSYFYEFGCAKFTAVKGRRRVNVESRFWQDANYIRRPSKDIIRGSNLFERPGCHTG